MFFVLVLVNIAPAFARGSSYQGDWLITKYHQPRPQGRPTEFP
jgi:hypothetical protein